MRAAQTPEAGGRTGRQAPGQSRTGNRKSQIAIWLPWLLLAAALLFFVWHSSSSAFLQDDSYITYRYARNVVRGLGPVFNPGERVEGYTNFIWMMMVAVLGIIGLPFSTIIPLTQVIGVACGALVIVLFFFLLRRLSSGPPWLAPAGVLLLAANGSFAYWCVSGMESGLFALLVAAAAFFYLREHTRRNLFLTSAFLGLAALVRPEGALFLAIFTLDFLIRNLVNRQGRQEEGEPQRQGSSESETRVTQNPKPKILHRLLVLIAPFVVLVAPLYAWRLAYYRQFFPNTFYAKTGLSVSYFQSGIKYLVEFYQAFGLWGIAFIVPLFLAARARRLSPGSPLFFSVLVLLVHTLYTVSVGGDVLRIYRFFVPVLVLFYFLVTEGIWLVSRQPAVRALLLAALLPLTFIGPLARPRSVRADIKRNLILETGLVDKMAATGRWLNQKLGPDDWFACTTIGAVSWFADRNMVDMLGLTDAHIAHNPEDILGRKVYWKERNYNTRHVLERNPACIYFSTGIKPSAAAERALFLRPRFRRGYYAYPFSAPTRNDMMSEIIHKARPGADTIPLEPVAEHPEFMDYYVDGINLLRRNQDSALASFRKCIRVCPPDFGYPFEWIGSIFIGRKPAQTDSALYYYEEAVRRSDWCISSHTNIASIYARRGELGRALEHLEKVVAYAPDSYDGYANLAVTYSAFKDYDRAEAIMAIALEKFPFAPDAALRLAYVRIEAGRLDAARDVLDRLLKERPGDRNALQLLDYLRQKQPK